MDLIKKALEAQKNSHSPYSKFAVGCAVETTTGKVFTGCNVENANYAGTICAERVAVTKAVSEGHKGLKRLAIVGPTENYIVPCGMCLQMIVEFGTQVEVICSNRDGSNQKTFKMKELLPHSFDQSFLP